MSLPKRMFHRRNYNYINITCNPSSDFYFMTLQDLIEVKHKYSQFHGITIKKKKISTT